MVAKHHPSDCDEETIQDSPQAATITQLHTVLAAERDVLKTASFFPASLAGYLQSSVLGSRFAPGRRLADEVAAHLGASNCKSGCRRYNRVAWSAYLEAWQSSAPLGEPLVDKRTCSPQGSVSH